MSTSPIFIQVLLGLVTFAVTAATPPKSFWDTLHSEWSSILYAACGQMFVVPIVLFYFLSMVSEAKISYALITTTAIPSIGVVTYLVFLARGSVPIAIWSTTLSVGLTTIVLPGLPPIWAIVAPETSHLVPTLHLNSAMVIATMACVHVLPSAMGIALRSEFPQFASRYAEPLAHAVMPAMVIYCVLTLPIKASWDHAHLLDVLFVGALFLLCLLVACFYAFAIRAAPRYALAIVFLVPSKLTILTMLSPYFGASQAMPEHFIVMSWSFLQVVCGAAAALFYRLRDRAPKTADTATVTS